MVPIALWPDDVEERIRTEGLGHALLGATCAGDFDVGCLHDQAVLNEPEFFIAVRGATVDKLSPREVVEMPVFAGDQKAGGNDRSLVLVRDVGLLRAVLVNVLELLRSVRI
jgi:hypothetical protein